MNDLTPSPNHPWVDRILNHPKRITARTLQDAPRAIPTDANGLRYRGTVRCDQCGDKAVWGDLSKGHPRYGCQEHMPWHERVTMLTEPGLNIAGCPACGHDFGAWNDRDDAARCNVCGHTWGVELLQPMTDFTNKVAESGRKIRAAIARNLMIPSRFLFSGDDGIEQITMKSVHPPITEEDAKRVIDAQKGGYVMETESTPGSKDAVKLTDLKFDSEKPRAITPKYQPIDVLRSSIFGDLKVEMEETTFQDLRRHCEEMDCDVEMPF